MKSPALTQWLTALTTAAAAGSFVKATLNKPTAKAGDLKSLDLRPILVKRQLKISFTYHHQTRDIVKNFSPPEAAALLTKLLPSTFTHAKLYTLEADHHLTLSGKTFTLTRHAASHTAAPSLSHDVPKQRPLNPTHKPYLHALGLTDAHGEVLKSAQDKFRQINKYIEVLDALIKPLPTDNPLTVADMGSGKGYLTFALYDHLTTTLGRTATVTGVEHRADMVSLCNQIALQSGFTGLHFVQGGISDYDCTNTQVVIALHACDTATDEAIAKGIHAGAQLIVVAPCCHKQLRKQLNTHFTAATLAAHPLGSMLRYGTYMGRMADMLTDTLRTLYLQQQGYTTNLFEFIATEHTPKNILITATRNPKPSTAAELSHIQSQIDTLKSQFGITRHALEI